jgi:hypothetical protein
MTCLDMARGTIDKCQGNFGLSVFHNDAHVVPREVADCIVDEVAVLVYAFLNVSVAAILLGLRWRSSWPGLRH